MPRVHERFLDSVIYLYPTVEDAQSGEETGGSGFLAGVRASRVEGMFAYAVTNSHVIREGRSPVVRLNTAAGATDVLPLTEGNWIHHPDGDDVAVAPLTFTGDHQPFAVIPLHRFALRDAVETHNYGPGDECVMVGRFGTHEGKQRNLPTVRFGNVSMMPWEPIEHPTRGIAQESYLVEARSLPGYSGSPVFIYNLYEATEEGQILPKVASDYELLGIDWCHLPDHLPVLDRDGYELPEEWWTKGNSGMMGVIPAWKIAEILIEDERLIKLRDELERKGERRKSEGVVLDVARESTSEFERFEELARRLVNVPKRELDEKRKEES